MTKMKNTKKGMAKKTLSISLAVAMLATSNVPVWAAEFSDGTDAAFTSEAPAEEVVEEAPVVEEIAEDVPEAQVVGDAWTVKLTNMPASVEWGNTDKVTYDITQTGATTPDVSTIKYVWKDAATGLSTGGASAVSAKGDINLPNDTASVGKSYVLYMYDEAGDWEYTSPAVAVTAKDISKAGVSITVTGSTSYTGKEVKPAIKIITGSTGLTDTDFNIDYTGTPDLINKESEVTVTVTAVNKTLYTGKVTTTFKIGAKTANVNDFSLSYIKDSYEYTGDFITPAKEDIRVTDVNGTVVDGAVTNVTATGKNVGSYVSSAVVDVTKFKNYTGTVGAKAVDGKYNITARDLSNCTATVSAMASTGKKAVVNPADVTIKGANGETLTLGNDITVTVPDDATVSGTYTITITPKTNNKNVVGSTTATLVLYAKNIADIVELDATATAELSKAAYFTGSQITKDVTKFVGHILNKTETGKPVLDTNQYTVEFGENVNAGTEAGIVRIVGKNTYAGSVAEFKFDIKAASITKKEVAEVVYKEGAKAEDYAPAVTLTARNGAGQTWTLKEGTDYTVKYKFNAKGNTVGKNLIATVTYSAAAQNNYGMAATEELAGSIVYPSLTDANIKMEKTSYEYTGAAIVPEYKVYDGTKELKENVDYVVKNTIGGKDVGTATLVIAGAPGSKYNPNTTAKATFKITPVSAEKVEVKVNTAYTFDGKAHKPTLADIAVTLNGNDVKSQFDISSYGENINAGKETGSLVLIPKKDNKNFVAGTSKTAVFEIKQKTLAGGTLKVYNEKGIDITDKLPEFDYDGTAKTFAKVVYTPADTNVTADDYEIKYVNNTTGDTNNEASIIVVAKGNYKATDTVNDVENDAKIENVVLKKTFTINSKLYFTEKEVTVTDAEYAEGVLVKPVIVVKDGGKVLVEDKDYKVTLTPANGATKPGDTGNWTVTGLGVYKDTTDGKNTATGTWKVVKKDVKNLDIKVDLDAAGKPVLTVMNGNIKVDNKNFDVKLSEDKKTATVSATVGNKYYVGSVEVTVGGEAAVVGAPMITDVKVVGNKATVILSGEVDGATGYDYVISTANDYKNNRVAVNKNTLLTESTFNYTEPGVYYAYCHAWRRGADGKKIFGEWSNIYPFSVTAITPSQPVVTSVKVSGSTVTVTYTKAANAEGYDVVLGSKVATVAGEKRPVEYGTLVKKNIKGNTVTAVFKNVPKGTYYAGLHAFNRTSEDGKKVFSPWSNIKTVKVK